MLALLRKQIRAACVTAEQLGPRGTHILQRLDDAQLDAQHLAVALEAPYSIEREGKLCPVYLYGARTFRDLLVPEEIEKVKSGELSGVNARGSTLDLTSPLEEGACIVLKAFARISVADASEQLGVGQVEILRMISLLGFGAGMSSHVTGDLLSERLVDKPDAIRMSKRALGLIRRELQSRGKL